MHPRKLRLFSKKANQYTCISNDFFRLWIKILHFHHSQTFRYCFQTVKTSELPEGLSPLPLPFPPTRNCPGSAWDPNPLASLLCTPNAIPGYGQGGGGLIMYGASEITLAWYVNIQQQRGYYHIWYHTVRTQIGLSPSATYKKALEWCKNVNAHKNKK